MAGNNTALGRVVTAPQYRILTGLSWPGQRAEVGEVRDDVPAASLPWLLEQGLVELVEEGD